MAIAGFFREVCASEHLRQNITGQTRHVRSGCVEITGYLRFRLDSVLAYSLLPLKDHFCQYVGAGCACIQPRRREPERNLL